MRVAISLMYIASAVLPVLGIVLLYRGARRDAATMNGAAPVNDGDGASISEFNVSLPILIRSVRERPMHVKRDLLMIGAGVVFGAAASIWSLFI